MVGEKTTFKNIIQINKLAGVLESFQNKSTQFCCIFATKSEFVVFFAKFGLLLCQK